MNEVWRARSGIVARVGARVVRVRSGRGGSGRGGVAAAGGAAGSALAAGRIYPLACLVAIAVCAFTAAGNDRFRRGRAVGQASRAGGSGPAARPVGSGRRAVPGAG